MQKTDILRQCVELFEQAAGAVPNTVRWLATVEGLLERGVKAEVIIKAVKNGLGDSIHKPRLLDRGLPYVAQNLYVLLNISESQRSSGCPDLTKPLAWEIMRHEFEHAFHAKYGRLPSLEEGSRELERIVNRLGAASEVRTEYACPICGWGKNIESAKKKPMHDVPDSRAGTLG